MVQNKRKEKMKNPAKESRVSSEAETFDDALDAALKHPVISFEEKEVREWIDQFIAKARPCLKELYESYRIPPDLIFVWAAICAQAPVPQTFPAKLRNGRQRERTATLLETAAETIKELGALDMYGVTLFSDAALDLKLKAAAIRIRQLRSTAGGRPKSYIMRDFAILLAELFRLYAKSPLHNSIDTLLHAAYPKDVWALHGEVENAVCNLIGGQTSKDWFTSADSDFRNLHAVEERKLVADYEQKLTASNMTAPIYQRQLMALLKLAHKYKINAVVV